MSERQDDIAERRRVQLEESLRSAAGGRLWSAQDLEAANTWGTAGAASVFVPGDRFQLGSAQQYIDLGFSGVSPDPKKGLLEYLKGTGESLPVYQARTGGLPLRFDADGTAVYDPSAYTANYRYEPGPDWFETVIPALILSVGALGMAGVLPGTGATAGASAAGGVVAGAEAAGGLGGLADFSLAAKGTGFGGVGTAGLGLGSGGSAIGLTPALATGGGTLLSGGLIGATADGLAAAAGAGALSSIPASAQLGSLVGGASLTFPTPSPSMLPKTLNDAAGATRSVASIVQSAAAIDAATSKSTPFLAASAPTVNPLFFNLGGQDMATKTGTAQTQQPTQALAPMTLQSLLPIAVLVVAVLALGDMKGE